MKSLNILSISKNPVNSSLEKFGLNYSPSKSFETALGMLNAGRADVFIASYAITKFYLIQKKYSHIKCSANFYKEGIGLGISKSSKYIHLKNKMNKLFKAKPLQLKN